MQVHYRVAYCCAICEMDSEEAESDGLEPSSLCVCISKSCHVHQQNLKIEKKCDKCEM